MNVNLDSLHAELTRRLQQLSSVRIPNLAPDTPFFSTGLIDSTSIVELIVFVEQHYGIVVDPSDLSVENFDSMQAIGNYVQRKQAGTA